MKTTLFTAVIAVAAIFSLLQIRLTAQDKTEATIETVKAQMETLKSKLEDLKGAAEQTKDDSKQLEERVKNHLDRLKELASEPSKLPLDIQRRIELLKADEEDKQLQALDGADKLGDEGLLLCGFAAKEIGRDSVREKALAIAAAKGEEGLPVIVFAVGSLTADNRTFLLKELVKNKEKVAPLVFARFAKDDVAANRELALKTGLSIAKNPLIFLALAADGNESNADSLFAAGSKLQGDDLQLFLFAVAVKGPEELLVTTVQKAVALKTDGYPIIAAAYKRDIAAVRGEIVRQFRKSTIPVEQFVVREALKDGDETLRSAAEKANQEP
jgi:hypothetical protein